MQHESIWKTLKHCCAANYYKPPISAGVPLSFTVVPPEWQNMCERWHWTCSPQTTEPQEPNNNDKDSTHPCLRCCEVSITGGVGGWLLPVSLTGRGVTGGGKAWRTSAPSRVVGKYIRPQLHCIVLNYRDWMWASTFTQVLFWLTILRYLFCYFILPLPNILEANYFSSAFIV